VTAVAVHLPALLVVVPLGLGLSLPLLALRWPRLQEPVTVAGAWLTALLALGGVGLVLAAGPQRYHVGGWAPPWGIELVLDPLSAFVAAVVAGVAACALLYGAGLGDPRLQGRAGSAGALSLLLLSALMGIVVTGDLFNLFVFLEVASLATYGLIAAGDGRALLAALRYVILGSLGASLYLLGVGYLYLLTGTLNMADLAARLPAAEGARLLPVGVALMVVGLGIKMGLFPLHGWLPDAYTYAPPAVAALLAPVATKVAAYALARVLYSVVGADWILDRSLLGPALAWAGAVSVVAGGLLAIRQTDLRRLLAYSSVSQIGYIVLGLGVGTPGALAGAYLHILHHALMKASLFFVAGAVAPAAQGPVAVADLCQLSRRMPLVTVALVVAAVSMVGIPPAGGFFSKWYLLVGTLEGGRWGLAAVVLLGGLLAVIYMFRILEAACLTPREAHGGESHTERVRRREPRPAVLLPLLALALAILAAGLASARIVDGLLAPVLPPGPQ
jgi:multicomponent Na+:H+ antiporter subunit D